MLLKQNMPHQLMWHIYYMKYVKNICFLYRKIELLIADEFA